MYQSEIVGDNISHPVLPGIVSEYDIGQEYVEEDTSLVEESIQKREMKTIVLENNIRDNASMCCFVSGFLCAICSCCFCNVCWITGCCFSFYGSSKARDYGKKSCVSGSISTTLCILCCPCNLLLLLIIIGGAGYGIFELVIFVEKKIEMGKHNPHPLGYTHFGCVNLKATNWFSPTDLSETYDVSTCYSACKVKPLSQQFGLANGKDCYVDFSAILGEKVSMTKCNEACEIDPKTECGGNGYMDVYEIKQSSDSEV